MTVQINLTKGQSATVCDCHARLVIGYKWRAWWNPCTESYYAMRHATLKEKLFGTSETVLMHVSINNTPKGFRTDHIDRNTLNNCCWNLRAATPSQSGSNRNKQSNNTSGFKGVSFHKLRKKWRAYIKINSKAIHIGLFDTPEDAAHAYDEKAIELYGEFASLNFPANT